MLIAIIFISAAITYVSIVFLPSSSIGELYVLFSLLPFCAYATTANNRKKADEISSSELLTNNEIRRFKETQQGKMAIYLVVSSISIVLAFSMIIAAIFYSGTNLYSVIVVFSLSTSSMFILINSFEDHQYHKLKQYLLSRKRKQNSIQERLSQLSNHMNGENHA